MTAKKRKADEGKGVGLGQRPGRSCFPPPRRPARTRWGAGADETNPVEDGEQITEQTHCE